MSGSSWRHISAKTAWRSAQRRVIAGAESCTGGLISAVLTSVSGSSAWVDRALVTYSNEAKMVLLGVNASTLDAFGAVSEQTAREMACGALRCADQSIAPNLAYSVTGVAGPTGGSPAKRGRPTIRRRGRKQFRYGRRPATSRVTAMRCVSRASTTC